MTRPCMTHPPPPPMNTSYRVSNTCDGPRQMLGAQSGARPTLFLDGGGCGGLGWAHQLIFLVPDRRGGADV